MDSEHQRPTSLQQVVELAMRRHDVADAAKLTRIASEAGFKVNNTTMTRLRRGTYSSKPTRPLLTALAWLAGTTYEVAREAAGISSDQPPFAQQLPVDVDLLTPKERAAVIELLRLLIEHHRRAAAVRADHDRVNRGAELGILTATAEELGLPTSNGRSSESAN